MRAATRPRDETRIETWRRRAVTIPTVFALGLLAAALLPLTATLAILAAPFERRRGATLRCVGFFTAYLVGELLFLTIAAAQWLAGRGWTAAGGARVERWTKWLGDSWGWFLYRCGRLFFGLRINVTGLDALAPGGPLIVFLRHASMGDTPLAPVFVGRHAGLRLRYIVKNELRMDPIFDVIGGRSRGCFVRRGSAQSEHEVAAVCALLEELGPRDGIVIFPEGTRFSAAKRARVLEQARKHLPPELLARAQGMRHVLPPRLGGPIALLEGNPGADVVFCAHVGYEGVASFRDLIDGRAIGRQIDVSFRRVPFAAIPRGREALARWLFEQWAQLDDWVAARIDSGPAGVDVAAAPPAGRLLAPAADRLGKGG